MKRKSKHKRSKHARTTVDPFYAIVGMSAAQVATGLRKAPLVFQTLLQAHNPAELVSRALSVTHVLDKIDPEYRTIQEQVARLATMVEEMGVSRRKIRSKARQ